MFVNFSAVMLHLCEPFLDANLSKRDKIDPEYVFHFNRLELRGLTALHASSEEVSEWINNNAAKVDTITNDNDEQFRLLQSQEATSSSSNAYIPSILNKNHVPTSSGNSKYPFICECFLMTSGVLNLGPLKAFSDFKNLVQDISRSEDTLSSFKAMLEQSPSLQLQQDISRLEKEIELYSQEK